MQATAKGYGVLLLQNRNKINLCTAQKSLDIE
jgi:hypothetical protein